MIAEREQWLPVPGYDGYFATRDGRVSGTRRLLADGSPHAQKQVPDRDGYPRVRFVRDGKRSWIKVSKVMALTFMPPRPSPVHQVRHLDGDNTNNAIGNLAWGTPKENCKDRDRHGTTVRGMRHHETHLTNLNVFTIRMRAKDGEHQKSIAKDFGIAQVTVSRIVRRVYWRHTP